MVHHQSNETTAQANDRAARTLGAMSPADQERAQHLLADASQQVGSVSGKQYQIEANNTFLTHPHALRSDSKDVADAAKTDQDTIDSVRKAQALLAKGDLKGAEKLLQGIDKLVSDDRDGDFKAAGTKTGPDGKKRVDGEGGTDGQNAKEEAVKIALEDRMLHEGKDQWGNKLTQDQIKALQLDKAETTAEFYNNVRDGRPEVGYAAADDGYTAARQALQANDTPENRANLGQALQGLIAARQQDKNNETGAGRGDDGYLGQDQRTLDSATGLARKFFKSTTPKRHHDGKKLQTAGILPDTQIVDW